MKKQAKLYFGILIMLMMSIGIFSAPLLVNAEENNQVETNIEVSDIENTYTSAPAFKSRMASSTATDVTLRSGNYANWIDRIEVPEYAQNFYDSLVEASDNDGNNDWLIDFSSGVETIGEKTCVAITNFSGKATSEEAMKEEINEKFSIVNKTIRAVYDAFDRDYPEVFWLSGETNTIVSYSWYSDYSYTANCYFVLKSSDFDIRANNYTDANNIKADITVRDNAINNITSSAPNSSTYDKIKYFNQWLTKNNGYNTYVSNGNSTNAPKSAWECISALSGNRNGNGPVCEGYARAFKVLCDKSNIPCTLVDGYARNGINSEAHMWNYVQVDGNWYAMDVTWNDPIVNGSDTEGNENYLLVGENTQIGDMPFINSHPVTNKASTNGIAFTNGPILNDEKYVVHVHNYTSTVKNPTCTEQGYTLHECNVCNDSYKDTYIEALGHSWNEGQITTEPTCTESGVKTYTCTRCNETKTEEIAKLEHVSGEWEITKEATCHEEGTKVKKCTQCNTVLESETIAKTEHQFGEWTTLKEATCTEAGSQQRECSICHDKETKNIPALGHEWDEGTVTKQATCTESGVKTYKCSRCNETKTEEIAKLEHVSGEWEITKEATCHEEGTKVKKCTQCNTVLESETIAKTEHQFGEWTILKEATCTEAGSQQRECSICHDKETKNIPALGHDWDEGQITKPATYLDTGVREYTCLVCHETKEETLARLEPEYNLIKDSHSTSLSLENIEIVNKSDIIDQFRKDNELFKVSLIINTIDKDNDQYKNDIELSETYAKNNGYNIMGHYDIYIDVINNIRHERITKTDGLLTLELTIPENYRKAGRVYKVLRVHNGEVTILDATVNENNDKLTFMSDQFSTYTIIYNDVEVSSTTKPNQTVSHQSSQSVKTGDESDVDLMIGIFMMNSISLFTLFFKKKYCMK